MIRTALMVVLAATTTATAAAVPAQASDPVVNNPSYVSKRVIVDPATGKILSITGVNERIRQRHYCNGHDACYMASKTPYADHGFYGSPGKKSGNWPNRGGYYTGAYYAKFCWNNDDICAAELHPRAQVVFPGGQTVTGSSVSIR